MKDTDLKPCTTVGVLFAEPAISELFCELALAHGVRSREFTSLHQINEIVPLITEPQFFAKLSYAAQKLCLVVTNHEDKVELNGALALQRPLTEKNVLETLEKFLNRE